MTDRVMSSKPTPTPGPWERKSMSVFATKHGNLVMAADGDFGGNGISLEEAIANADLIAEAGTVHHETGLTPQQLREQRDELLAVLRKIAEQPGKFSDAGTWHRVELARAAIASVEAAS
jgi:hypothetical protein